MAFCWLLQEVHCSDAIVTIEMRNIHIFLLLQIYCCIENDASPAQGATRWTCLLWSWISTHLQFWHIAYQYYMWFCKQSRKISHKFLNWTNTTEDSSVKHYQTQYLILDEYKSCFRRCPGKTQQLSDYNQTSLHRNKHTRRDTHDLKHWWFSQQKSDEFHLMWQSRHICHLHNFKFIECAVWRAFFLPEIQIGWFHWC